jgi:apolipoprotein D and lipocalin family protein
MTKMGESMNRTLGITGALVLFSVILLAGCAAKTPLRTESDFDLRRYMGTWYAIEHIPQRFERGCTCTMATYTLQEDGTVEVVNRCKRDGEFTSARGTGYPGSRPAVLTVKFSRLQVFSKDNYHVIHVTDGYEHALVGNDDRRSLWILSRRPNPDPQAVEGLRMIAEREGFDLGEVQPIVQDCW